MACLFCNVEKAKIADSTVGLDGTGLDFGVFCGRDTSDSVFGISLTETDGFAVPGPSGLGSSTNGESSFLSCTGSPTGVTDNNNVVRQSKSINTNSNVPVGQIGLDEDAWPLIQLFSFDDVEIEYNPGGPSQKVTLTYDEIPNISLSKDRDLYPKNSEVFLTINDFQLNQDPTDEDSWTFNVNSSSSVFYQAFDENGSDSANGGAGLVDLKSSLSSLGFEDNGELSVSVGNILELQSNDEQPATNVSDGTQTFSKILTFVENGPNSGIFDSGDDNDESNLGILDDAPRGQTGTIIYNDESMSILTGSSTASVALQTPSLDTVSNLPSLIPGTEFEIVLTDSDQNINSGAKDDLDIFRDTAIIPTMRIGGGAVGTVSNENNSQPIVIDFFSFGEKNLEDTNNSIYRFELEETSDDSSTFEGTFEYAVANQLNLSDPNFIKTIQTIDDDVKFIVVDRLVDDEALK